MCAEIQCMCIHGTSHGSKLHVLVHHNGKGCAVPMGSMLYRILVSLESRFNLYEVNNYGSVQSYFIAETFRGVQFSLVDDFHNFFSSFFHRCVWSCHYVYIQTWLLNFLWIVGSIMKTMKKLDSLENLSLWNNHTALRYWKKGSVALVHCTLKCSRVVGNHWFGYLHLFHKHTAEDLHCTCILVV